MALDAMARASASERSDPHVSAFDSIARGAAFIRNIPGLDEALVPPDLRPDLLLQQTALAEAELNTATAHPVMSRFISGERSLPALVDADPSAAAQLLRDEVRARLEAIAEVRRELQEDPDKVFSITPVLATARVRAGIAVDSWEWAAVLARRREVLESERNLEAFYTLVGAALAIASFFVSGPIGTGVLATASLAATGAEVAHEWDRLAFAAAASGTEFDRARALWPDAPTGTPLTLVLMVALSVVDLHQAGEAIAALSDLYRRSAAGLRAGAELAETRRALAALEDEGNRHAPGLGTALARRLEAEDEAARALAGKRRGGGAAGAEFQSASRAGLELRARLEGDVMAVLARRFGVPPQDVADVPVYVYGSMDEWRGFLNQWRGELGDHAEAAYGFFLPRATGAGPAPPHGIHIGPRGSTALRELSETGSVSGTPTLTAAEREAAAALDFAHEFAHAADFGSALREREFDAPVYHTLTEGLADALSVHTAPDVVEALAGRAPRRSARPLIC